ncbi:MAG: hypothetical protein GXZ09_01435 [Syntrophomonadaceae bacterium]|jgi:hypothetical protein|nr:hypothetical protein [Syntrophomonadaceae bacterium]
MSQKSTPERLRRLDRHHLDPHHYTLSLLKEAYRLKLIDQAGLDAIQSQMMELLARTIMRYTGGESSSVTNETAQRIMLSLFYAIDACMLCLDDSDEALKQLTTRGLASIYQQGLAVLESCLLSTEQIYRRLQEQRLKVDNLAYQTTLDEALPDFFKHYDVLYAAHETMASIDYPLFLDNMQVSGIFYIRNYLLTLTVEDCFCRRYSHQEIKKLLASYGRIYRINTSEALINIFEIAATNAVFSLLAGNPSQQLLISEAQLDMLYKMLSALDEIERQTMLEDQVKLLLQDTERLQNDSNPTPDEPWAAWLPIPSLKQLMEHLIAMIMPRLNKALEYGHLDNVAIVSSKAAAPDKSRTFFTPGVKMDDESFRNLTEELIACQDGAGKADLIVSRCQSLIDFIDILEADCLYEDEYQILYSRLGNMELALLAGMVFPEEIRISGKDFSLRALAGQSFGYLWQEEFSGFLQSLPDHRIKLIEHCIHSNLDS